MPKLVLNHNYAHAAQTMVQMFFPSPAACDSYVVESGLDDGFARATVYINGVEASSCVLPPSSAPYLPEKRMIMLALYHALQDAVGVYSPWGALVGIRPSKMVREWLNNGYSKNEVAQILHDPFCVNEEKAWLAIAVAQAERRLTDKIHLLGSKPVGIYVSIPFCPSRCVYCSFNTCDRPADADVMARYVQALAAECQAKATLLKQMGGIVSSIYIGGGTPTVLDDDLLRRVLEVVGSFFRAQEFTVEAGRPDTLTPQNLRILRSFGVNRLAVNPQTLNDRTLKIIGRNHTADDFFKAFDMARFAGFDCINTDVIVGLPGECADDMRRTMESIETLSPENITVHTLAVKRASRLPQRLGDYSLPDAHATESMLVTAAASIAKIGLKPYYLYRQKNMTGLFENVGYAKSGCECLYNVGMMAETQTVLGIGAGAVSKFVDSESISREFNPKSPELYIENMKKANFLFSSK